MVRIISDSSTMYSPQEARENGFDVAPLTVMINGESYRELEEISSQDFARLVRQGHMPRTSQPSIGEVMELYRQYPEDEILNISMADGLSGTYGSAATAAELCERGDSIEVLNSMTLCGPHRHLVEVAKRMAAGGAARAAIVQKLKELMKTEKSFLLPSDFDFLRRGGRLSPLVSFVGKTIRLSPVMTLAGDARSLVMAGVKRSYVQGVSFVRKLLTEHGVGEGWRIYITHADAPGLAEKAKQLLQEVFPKAIYEVYHLTPVFISQGGPDCVAIQAIRND